MKWISGNIFIRPMGGSDGLESGHAVPGHTHNFDHTSILFNGHWRVRKWRPAVTGDGKSMIGADGADVGNVGALAYRHMAIQGLTRAIANIGAQD
jgi:hypothetical protein